MLIQLDEESNRYLPFQYEASKVSLHKNWKRVGLPGSVQRSQNPTTSTSNAHKLTCKMSFAESTQQS